MKNAVLEQLKSTMCAEETKKLVEEISDNKGISSQLNEVRKTSVISELVSMNKDSQIRPSVGDVVTILNEDGETEEIGLIEDGIDLKGPIKKYGVKKSLGYILLNSYLGETITLSGNGGKIVILAIEKGALEKSDQKEMVKMLKK